MSEWYYSTSNRQQGPVSGEELRRMADEGSLKPRDLVWTEGMDDWASAGSRGFGPADEGAPPYLEFADESRAARRAREYREGGGRPIDRRPRRAEGMPVGLKVGLIVGAGVLLLIVVGVGLYVLMRPVGAREMALGLGTFQGALGAADPIDPISAGPSRVHEVRMVRGRTYFIEMQSGQLDSFLRLEDSGSIQLAQDDDSAGNLNARIVFRCPRNGNFRVIATCLPNGGRGNAVSGAYVLVIRETR